MQLASRTRTTTDLSRAMSSRAPPRARSPPRLVPPMFESLVAAQLAEAQVGLGATFVPVDWHENENGNANERANSNANANEQRIVLLACFRPRTTQLVSVARAQVCKLSKSRATRLSERMPPRCGSLRLGPADRMRRRRVIIGTFRQGGAGPCSWRARVYCLASERQPERLFWVRSWRIIQLQLELMLARSLIQ